VPFNFGIQAKLGLHPHMEGNDTQTASSFLGISRLDRSGGAARPVSIEKPRDPGCWIEPCQMGFASVGRDGFGPHGDSGHNQRGVAIDGTH